MFSAYPCTKTTVSSVCRLRARTPLPPTASGSSSSASTWRGTPSSATTVSGWERSDPNGVVSPTPRRAITRRRWATRQTTEPAAHPGHDLVGDRAARLGPLLRGGLALVPRPEERHRGTRLGPVAAEV